MGQKNKNKIMGQPILAQNKFVIHEEAACYMGCSRPKFIL